MNLDLKAMGLAGATLLAAGVPLSAADLPPAYAPPSTNPATIPLDPIDPRPWQGISVGLIGAYGFDGREKALTDANLKGPMIGGLAGIHGQTGNFVFGLEGDGTFSMMKGKGTTEVPGRVERATVREPFTDRPVVIDGTPAGRESGWGSHRSTVQIPAQSFTNKASIDAFYTLRARAGFALDNILFYGTGGLAISHAKVNATAQRDSTIFKFNDKGYGLAPVFGGGIDYRFDNNLSLRTEYLYSMPFKVKMTDESKQKHMNASFDGTHLVRVGLTYTLPVH